MTSDSSAPPSTVPSDASVVDEVVGPVVRPAHLGLALLSLAMGGFAIGTTEFMSMGLLPDIARGIGESVPTTGHVITAYAFGVVVGAPLLVSLGARLPRRGLAVALVLALGIGNAMTAVASTYGPVMLARFVAGLPHGAYFGVASLIAASMVPPQHRGRAISSVMLGLSVATVAGVPASTWFGQNLGWRSAYWVVLAIAALAALMILAFVPSTPGNPGATVRQELSALKRPQVVVAVVAGMVGFGGLFAMYTYIAKLVTDEAGLGEGAVPLFLLAFGVGSVGGTWIAGRMADWDVERSVVLGFVATAVTLVLVVPLAGVPVALAVLSFAIGGLGSVVAINLQVRLMHEAGDAEMLGAALNHSALNVGNGLGAWFGSIVIAGGYGYRAPSLVGAGLAVLGVLIFVVGGRVVRAREAAAD